MRVRLRGDAAFLTLKGGSQGISRSEFEYPIPVADALAMLDTLAVAPPVDKVRHLIPVGGHLWELDVFAGENAGLVMAEIELESEGEAFERPDWLGDEVSEDPRYYNANLARYPFRRWRCGGALVVALALPAACLAGCGADPDRWTGPCAWPWPTPRVIWTRGWPRTPPPSGSTACSIAA